MVVHTHLIFVSVFVGSEHILRNLLEELVTGKLIRKPVTAGVHTALPVVVFLCNVFVVNRAGAGEAKTVLFRKGLELGTGSLCRRFKLFSRDLANLGEALGVVECDLLCNHWIFSFACGVIIIFQI